MSTIEQAIDAASRCLAGVGIENPVMESEFLIAAFLQTPRPWLLLNRRQKLAAGQVRTLRRWLRAREKRKPLAYITGEHPFRDLNLKVNASVLIPRPETELLVEQALRVLDEVVGSVTVIDVGTGSGNIALSLAAHPKAHLVIGIDRSVAALKVARANHMSTKPGAPVRWVQGDLLRPLATQQVRAGVIIANLPYVRTCELETLEPELRWEPQEALDGGEDGLRFIGPCITQASHTLLDGGTLLLEIGSNQSREVTMLLENAGTWERIRIFRDLSGLPRIAQAIRRGR
jgi:release factor glutamine methyltransferase